MAFTLNLFWFMIIFNKNTIYIIIMKKDNNLIKVTNKVTGEARYFTKDFYVCKWVGCTTTSLTGIISNNSRKYHDWKNEIVDGSNILYKDINRIQ